MSFTFILKDCLLTVKFNNDHIVRTMAILKYNTRQFYSYSFTAHLAILNIATTFDINLHAKVALAPTKISEQNDRVINSLLVEAFRDVRKKALSREISPTKGDRIKTGTATLRILLPKA